MILPISNTQKLLMIIEIFINVALILAIYVMANIKLLKSIKPITKGIQDLSAGACVHVPEKGVLSEISSNINCTSDILQKQQEQLENSPNLSEALFRTA